MITKLEAKRQSAHILFGILLVTLLYLDWIDAALLGIATVLVTLLSFIEHSKIRIALFNWLLENLERKSEAGGMRAKGLVFYLFGSTLAVYLFPKDIAMASVLILAFGDSFSRLVGPYGYLKHPWNSEKFIDGVLAGFLVATLAAWAFVPLYQAALASAAAMILESLDIEINEHKVDDNFTIPVVAGAVMVLVSQFAFLF
jgi:diacylglycerol kinase (CTP)